LISDLQKGVAPLLQITNQGLTPLFFVDKGAFSADNSVWELEEAQPGPSCVHKGVFAMPAPKKQQSNAMLYTVVTFVSLFVIATTVAVIYYVKAEEYNTQALMLTEQIDELATADQRRAIGSLVGASQPRKSRLGTMLDYLDTTLSLIVGGLPENTSAEVKVDMARRANAEAISLIAKDYPDLVTEDPNQAGLARMVGKLKTVVDNLNSMNAKLQQRLDNLQQQFDDAMAASFEKEQALLAEKEAYQQQVNEIKADYEQLKALTKQTAEEQAQTLMTRLDNEKSRRQELSRSLLKTEAELKMAQARIERLQSEIGMVKPPPDKYIAALDSDGKIILIDDRSGIVHINIGRDDHVYRGLTFGVYDKNAPIPRDGTSKAEIEVFEVGPNFAGARIIRSSRKNPIVLDDVVANLIWDSERTNVFVVAGDFDIDADGDVDGDAVERIAQLITNWGGRIEETVSAETDFVVLGRPVTVLPRPTFDDIEIDPTAMEKYEASAARLARYRQVETRAVDLQVPIFNLERFLYFIGASSQIGTPGFL